MIEKVNYSHRSVGYSKYCLILESEDPSLQKFPICRFFVKKHSQSFQELLVLSLLEGYLQYHVSVIGMVLSSLSCRSLC